MTKAWQKSKTVSMFALIALFAFVLALVCVQDAYASEREDLDREYQAALLDYEELVVEQTQNDGEIVQVESEIQQTQEALDEAHEQLDTTAKALYKHQSSNYALFEYVLGASTFQEAVMRFDTYDRITDYYNAQVIEYSDVKERLSLYMQQLQAKRLDIQLRMAEAKRTAEAAAAALAQFSHSDGAQYHQVQGVGNNCGATSFIVGVNIILHENRYMDNVAVWSGAGFEGDSTANLAYKGNVWLLANGLSGMIQAETVSGDIHSAQEMRSLLEDGKVVIVSSGPGSMWQRADGTQETGVFPYGHWIVFYHYENGVYYSNDSSVDATKGAGCPYTEEQMQQWLDGRSNHFAVTLTRI